jgi:hypothetical protein
MRTALASLIVAAGLVTVANAQEPAAPAPAAQPTAPAAPPATTSPTATPPAATPPATTTPPAATPEAAAPVPGAVATPAPAATPAPGAEATPAPAAEPPTLPTTGDGAVLLSVIEKVCVPLVRGGNLEDLSKALGMKKNRRDNSYALPLGGDKNYTITVFPLGANKDVCRGEVHYAINQTEPLVKALNVWAFLHQPELILQANYVKVYDDGVKRVQRSWEHLEANSSHAVNFTTLTKPDDSSLSSKYSAAEFYYQERKF